MSRTKVYNEIEFCRVSDLGIKNRIEKAFLENRLSYCERWEEVSFFRKFFSFSKEHNAKCVICINSLQQDKAEEIMASMGDIQDQIEMIRKKVSRIYF